MLSPMEWIIFGAACAAVAIILAVGFGCFSEAAVFFFRLFKMYRRFGWTLRNATSEAWNVSRHK